MKWISVRDRLPENGLTVLLYSKIDEIQTGWLSGLSFETSYDCISDVTHWMPLPEPPEN